MPIHWRRWGWSGVIVLALAACGSSTAPPPPPEWDGDFSFTFDDAVGDTLPAQGGDPGPAIDLVRFEGTMTAASFTFRLTFSQPVAPWSSGFSNRLDGFIDFDIDQATSTGTPSAVDLFGGNAALGTDLFLLLRDDFTGAFLLVSALNGSSAPVSTAFADSVVIVDIPRSFFGNDDGEMDVAAVFHLADRKASDILPNTGHLEIRRP